MRLIIAVLLLAILVVGLRLTHSQEAPEFITAAVERGRITSVVKATGTIEAVVTVDISSQFSGRIADVLVDFNDEVKSGQVLARLDPETFIARVNEARAVLKIAQSNVELRTASRERARAAVGNSEAALGMAEAQLAAARAKLDGTEKLLQRQLVLVKDRAVSEAETDKTRAQRDFEAADIRASAAQINMKKEAIVMANAELLMSEANVRNAAAVVEQKQATLDQSEVELDRSEIRAPIDGIVIKRDINPGQTIAVNFEAKTLFKIAKDLREMEVHGKIDEADIGRVKIRQPVQFTVDTYPDRPFGGLVRQIRNSPDVVQNVVTYTAIISAPNPDLLLLPGMTAQLQVTVSDTGEVMKIPNQALRFKPANTSSVKNPDAALAAAFDGRSTVWALNGTRLNPILVRLGASDDASAELLDGPISEGAELVVGIANSQNQKRFFGIRVGF